MPFRCIRCISKRLCYPVDPSRKIWLKCFQCWPSGEWISFFAFVFFSTCWIGNWCFAGAG